MIHLIAVIAVAAVELSQTLNASGKAILVSGTSNEMFMITLCTEYECV